MCSNEDDFNQGKEMRDCSVLFEHTVQDDEALQQLPQRKYSSSTNETIHSLRGPHHTTHHTTPQH